MFYHKNAAGFLDLCFIIRLRFDEFYRHSNGLRSLQRDSPVTYFFCDIIIGHE